jgi:hypothetical protein
MYQPDPPGGQPAEPRRPPAPVLTAVKLMYAGAAVSAVYLIILLAMIIGDTKAVHASWNGHRLATSPTITLGIVPGLVVIALWLWMARANRQRRNWARILSTVLSGLATLQLIKLISDLHRPTAHAGSGEAVLSYGVTTLFAAAWLAGAAAVWLLWRPASSAFFKPPDFPQAGHRAQPSSRIRNIRRIDGTGGQSPGGYPICWPGFARGGRAATSCRAPQKRPGHFENLIRAVLKPDAVDPRCTGHRVPVQCVVPGPAVRPRQVSRGEWRSPPFPRGGVLLQARHAVIADEPLVAHGRLLHDPPRADVLRHGNRHDGGRADRPEAVGNHSDRRLGGVSLVPSGPGVVAGEVDFRPCSLIDWPQAALPGERLRRLVFDGPHRMAKLALHHLALPDDALG